MVKKKTERVKYILPTEEQKTFWVNKRNEKRINPEPFALVQHPEVYK